MFAAYYRPPPSAAVESSLDEQYYGAKDHVCMLRWLNELNSCRVRYVVYDDRLLRSDHSDWNSRRVVDITFINDGRPLICHRDKMYWHDWLSGTRHSARNIGPWLVSWSSSTLEAACIIRQPFVVQQPFTANLEANQHYPFIDLIKGESTAEHSIYVQWSDHWNWNSWRVADIAYLNDRLIVWSDVINVFYIKVLTFILNLVKVGQVCFYIESNFFPLCIFHVISSVSTFPHDFLITGDFNIHVDDLTDSNAIQFVSLLDHAILTQHVLFPTHRHSYSWSCHNVC